jgi:hypothetical protein
MNLIVGVSPVILCNGFWSYAKPSIICKLDPLVILGKYGVSLIPVPISGQRESLGIGISCDTL